MKSAILLVFIVVCFYAIGCAETPPVDNGNFFDENGASYLTINGAYFIHIYEEEDTCYPSDDESAVIDEHTWMYVVMEDELDDGSYLVQIILSDLYWPEVIVNVDGTFENDLVLYNIWDYNISGAFDTAMTEDGSKVVTVSATINLITLDYQNPEEEDCRIVYAIDGYYLFEAEQPPEGFFE